jgi:hypothetical protein
MKFIPTEYLGNGHTTLWHVCSDKHALYRFANLLADHTELVLAVLSIQLLLSLVNAFL